MSNSQRQRVKWPPVLSRLSGIFVIESTGCIYGEKFMNKFKTALIAFWKDEDGLTTVEYAIAGALVGAAVIAAFTLLGETVEAQIQQIIAAFG